MTPKTRGNRPDEETAKEGSDLQYTDSIGVDIGGFGGCVAKISFERFKSKNATDDALGPSTLDYLFER
jgi:hypothetical protein